MAYFFKSSSQDVDYLSHCPQEHFHNSVLKAMSQKMLALQKVLKLRGPLLDSCGLVQLPELKNKGDGVVNRQREESLWVYFAENQMAKIQLLTVQGK